MARTLAMFTDVSLCIGCRARQVACKQWNQLAPEEPEWTGTYQNHAHFTDKSYRLVRFFEETDDKGQIKQWHMMSDVSSTAPRPAVSRRARRARSTEPSTEPSTS